LSSCDASKSLPSRAIHAEANAIAQAAKYGISTEGAKIYVTLEPCLSCLKLIISAGIDEVYYETHSSGRDSAAIRDSFVKEGLVKLQQVQLSDMTAQIAAASLLKPTSVVQAKPVDSPYLRRDGVINN